MICLLFLWCYLTWNVSDQCEAKQMVKYLSPVSECPGAVNVLNTAVGHQAIPTDILQRGLFLILKSLSFSYLETLESDNIWQKHLKFLASFIWIVLHHRNRYIHISKTYTPAMNDYTQFLNRKHLNLISLDYKFSRN